MIRSVIIAGLVATVLLVLAEGAAACSCVPPKPKKMLRQADGAVVARLLEVKPVGHSALADFIYRTGRVVKGRPGLERGRRLVVRSQGSESICGLSRSPGRLTGLFLWRDEGRWHSGLCNQIPAKAMQRLPQAPASSRASGAACP